MQSVGGLADLDVNLGSLTDRLSDLTYSVESFGRLQISSIEYLDAATGRDTWKSGRLEFDVVVQGNTFLTTDGQAGIVSGAFFGESHEGMGGTIEREDLAAAFGGSRLGATSGIVLPTDTPAVLHDNAWGVWATVKDDALFTATLGAAAPLDPLTNPGPTNSYAPLISGSPTGTNPVGGLNSGTWLGKALAYEVGAVRQEAPTEGGVQVKVDFLTLGVEARFDFTAYNGSTIASYASLQDGDGTFESDFLNGNFYGSEHVGVAGTFKSIDLQGVFGAVRQ